MNCHLDVCRANPDIFDFVDSLSKAEREGYIRINCPYYYNISKALKEAKARWKLDLENGVYAENKMFKKSKRRSKVRKENPTKILKNR